MKRKELIRVCQQYDENCQGCPYVNTHGGCTVGQPWKQAGTKLVKFADGKLYRFLSDQKITWIRGEE